MTIESGLVPRCVRNSTLPCTDTVAIRLVVDRLSTIAARGPLVGM